MPRKTPRPRVSVNMAMSLDGKISTYRRENIVLGTPHDRRLMDELRCTHDAVIVGAGTLRYDGFPIVIRYPDLAKKRLAAGSPPHPLNVVLSRRLDLPLGQPFFTRPDTMKLVITTQDAPASRLARVSRIAEVVSLAGKTVTPGAAMRTLASRGVKSVLLEGGGEIHYAFARAGLVDEVYITLTPRLLGGADAPTLMDGRGFTAARHPKLELVSSRRVGDELYLRYRTLAD